MEALIVPLVMVATLGGFAVANVWQKRRRRRVLSEVAEGLGWPSPVASDDQVIGNLGVRTVALCFVMRGSGKSKTAWTEVKVRANFGNLQLSITPQTLTDVPLIAVGLTIDIRTGDAEFDRAFVVEGAPTDLVRWFCNETVRRNLLAHAPCELQIDPTSVVLARRGHCRQSEDARGLIASACEISDQLPVAVAAAERAAQHGIGAEAAGGSAQSVGPYREGGATLVRLDEKRHAEMERLEVIRARRALARNVGGLVMVVMWMAFVLRSCHIW